MQTIEKLDSGQLKGVKKIQMSCGLNKFPTALYTLADTLEMLDLSGNNLSTLPNDFYRLHKLRILFLSDNHFTVFPEVLGKCEQLDIIGFKSNQIKKISDKALPPNTRWLILTNNKLKELPKSIGKCSRMQKLMLAGNQLKNLPTELQNCRNLELLRISANKMEALPKWLLQMPKLSWIAFAGNPFNSTITIEEKTLNTIEWSELMLQERLGEGASGVIWKALWNKGFEGEEQVAVKLFKGTVTSDGLPQDEMHACMLAGNHPNLVNLLGKITNHPEQKKGLLLSLIPSHYTNLGNPPSLESCTRDVFNKDTSFNLNQTLVIAKGIASVAVQLHNRGVMHGDLYAHNILIGPDAHPLFGDFGAASLYNPNDKFESILEKIEVCAFGCLLDDLLKHTKEESLNAEQMKIMRQLKKDCMREMVNERPTFNTIFETLEGINGS